MRENTIVWLVDDDASILWVLEKALEQAKIKTRTFERAEQALKNLSQETPAVIVTDIHMPGINGLDFLQEVNSLQPDLPVIIMTAYSDLDSAVSAYQGGAFEYLPKPFDVDEAVELVRRAVAQRMRGGAAKSKNNLQSSGLIGSAPAMQEVFRAIGRLSRANINVLITGESGTGKELVAKALHEHSPRAQAPFIAINTAAIPRELLESELFGHEKGAFTGALSQRHGRFEQADKGSLFLDEIGDMPAELQTRLLRVLADGTFFRVGGHSPIKVDVRIIAATHQDLETAVREGRFREDLYHRLNVVNIHLPPLRRRTEDIPALAGYFLTAVAKELGTEVKVLHADTLRCLCGLDWPGNVRQLENVCRWLSVMTPGKEVLPTSLPADLQKESGASPHTQDWQQFLRQWAAQRLNAGSEALLEEALPEFERALIETVLHHTQGHRQESARLLGWGRNTLTRKIKELDIHFDK